ncbi:MAG: M1 family aminopeptidase [Bacteroidota bacterium]
MLWKIIQFELQYRAKRPATYIYFAIMFLLAFLGMAVDELTIGGGTGQVKDNAPTVIANILATLSALPGLILASGIMGVPVLRDFQHKTDSMMFTAPIKKRDYLFGRFFGSFLVALFVFSGALFGLMIGGAMPWLEPERMLPYHVWHYIQPFLVIVVPSLFLASAFFFLGGTLSKRLLFVFTQGALLLVLYLIGVGMLSSLENREIAALFDPLGMNTLSVTSQYWTVTEQNSQVFALEGLLLFNRLIWIGIGILVLAITYWRFDFTTSFRKKKKKAAKTSAPTLAVADALPIVQLSQGWRTNLTRITSLTRLYLAEVVKSIPFVVITGLGLVMFFIGASNLPNTYGTDPLPTTFLMLEEIGGFNLFFFIIVIFYAGELIWRERDVKIQLIYDALPIPDFVGLVAKFLAMVVVYAVLLFVLMLSGVLVQTLYGYFEYQIGVYLSSLYSETLLFLILFTLLAFFIQVMANHKFLGHALMVLFFISTIVFNQIGLEHNLFQFASGGLGAFSDMNTYGHYVMPFSWYQLYWFGFGLILFAVAVTFSVRGTDSLMKTRLRLAKLRFIRPVLITTAAAIALFVSSGSYIYYNTNVLNEYRTSEEGMDLQADYEKTLKQYQDQPQPKIVETQLAVDIFPYQRNFDVKGHYILKNKTDQPMSEIHIQHPSQSEMEITRLEFERMDSLGAGQVGIKDAWEQFGFEIYEMDRPLQPGDSLKLTFEGRFETLGFVESGSNTNVVFNGTFFNNSYFPGLGYDPGFELGSTDERRERDLEERERMRERDDPIGRHINLVGDDADHIRFDITMSTATDQIAVAPGYLQREWEENDRRYFHYQMDVPMFNFYAMVSARYEVMREFWTAPNGQEIKLEIYYHPGHDYNLDRMMLGMKDALGYYSEHFSPYQYRQMRILEFPRYASFAQSFANTVPFSEGMGFILDMDEDDVDMAYYVTAHEMAHQWWGHQVTEASVKGNAMLSETMSQYSALMVMKHRYPPEMMQKFLKFELDRYLGGRASETKKEQPLELVEGQGYIHYRKGSLIMYALQDYLGEDSVNAALERYVDDWAWRDDIYPTSEDLLGYFREVTPDSLSYLITDMFETITLYENRVTTAEATQLANGAYQVSLELDVVKFRADSLGIETEIPHQDWIDVGIYGETSAGKDTLLYLEKHQFSQKETQILIEVDQEPSKAGIDPINKLIDRNPKDNTQAVSLISS